MKNALRLCAAALVVAASLALTGCPPTWDVDGRLAGTASIDGIPQVGWPLTANTDNLGGSGNLFFRWMRVLDIDAGTFTVIPGATRATYTPLEADMGRRLVVEVRRSGRSGYVLSEPTAPVLDMPDLAGTVGVAGTFRVGYLLTADTDGLDGLGNLSFQWGRIDTAGGLSDIPRATRSTLLLTHDDAGKRIFVTVSRAGYRGSIASDPSDPVEAAPLLTGTVAVQGTARSGETLMADTDGLGGTGDVSFQWRRTGASGGAFADIPGATGPTHLLTHEDAGRRMAVTVSRTGNFGTVTSVSTGVVADLMAWHPVAGAVFGYAGVNAVAFGGGLWVAAGAGGRLAYSADGETWTPVYPPVFAADINGVAYGGGRWMAVGPGGLAVSADGMVWTAATPPTAESMNAVAFGAGLWVVGGGNVSDVIMASGDGGDTWVPAGNPLGGTAPVNGIAFAGGRWVAVGGYGNMAVSDDGLVWTAFDTRDLATIHTVSNAAGLWIAAGSGGGMSVSVEGTAWTPVPGAPFGPYADIRAMAYGSGKWVAAGGSGSGSLIAVSADGLTWAFVADTAFGKNGIRDIAYGAGRWVAVGAVGTMAFSDGVE